MLHVRRLRPIPAVRQFFAPCAALPGAAGAAVSVAVAWLVLALTGGAGAEALLASLLRGSPGGVLTTTAAATGGPVSWSALGGHGQLWPARLALQGSPLALLVLAPILGAAVAGWWAGRLAHRHRHSRIALLCAAALWYGLLIAVLAGVGARIDQGGLATVRTPPALALGLGFAWCLGVGWLAALVAGTAPAGPAGRTRVRRRYAFALVVVLVGAQLTLTAAAPASAVSGKPLLSQPGRSEPAPVGYHHAGEQSALAAVRTESSAAGGTVLVGEDPWRGVPSTLSLRSPLGRDIPTWLRGHASLFGIADPPSQLRSIPHPKDPLGQRHDWYQQVVGGVPVYAARLGVHRDSSGRYVEALTNDLMPDLATGAAQATLSAADAVTAAGQAMPGSHPVQPPALYWLPGDPEPNQPTPATLAWRVWLGRAGTDGHAVTSQAYWVDARSTGRIIAIEPTTTPALFRSVWDFNNVPDVPANATREEGQPASGQFDVDREYEYSGNFFNYFQSAFGRDSYDAVGSPLIAAVRYRERADQPYLNAQWAGDGVTYFGEGMVTQDIVAHEWTHAITQYTADLLYMFQSGALNESFSDIFGETVEAYANNGVADFLLGEGSVLGPLRSMADPPLYGDPGNAKDFLTGCDDWGHVHKNSGIPNKSYYILASRIGLAKAAAIYYRDLTVYLGPRARFTDARNGAIQAAYDLFGKGSTEANEAWRAWGAVGVDGVYEAPRQDCPCFADQSLDGAGVQGLSTTGASADQIAAALLRFRDLLMAGDSAALKHGAEVYAKANEPALTLMLADDQLRQRTAHAMQSLQPALSAVGTPAGDTVVVTRELVDELLALTDAYIAADAANGTGDLAILLRAEKARLDPYAMVGMSVNQALAYLDNLYG
jgi:Zn-dependent metalloprotease